MQVAGSVPVSITGGTQEIVAAVNSTVQQFGQNLTDDIIAAVIELLPAEVKQVLQDMRS